MSTPRTPKAGTGDLCVVTIGVFRLDMVMPIDAGISLIRLLKNAQEVEPRYKLVGHRPTFRPGRTLTAELLTIERDQLVADEEPPPTRAAAPLALPETVVRRLK